MLNKLLLRQIQKHFGNIENIPENLSSLINVISESYDHYEKDRNMLERSIELSSYEMIELNGMLRRETQAVKEANNELNKIFNTIDQAIFSVDMVNYRLTKISAACEKIYGYKPEEFYSQVNLWQDVIHPEDKHISFEQIDLLSEGKQIFNQYRIIHKNKLIRWIENSITPTLDKTGKLIRIDGVTSDITDRKYAEEKVRKSEANLQTIFDNGDTAYILIDTNLRIVSFNQPAKKFAGEELGCHLHEGKYSLDCFTAGRSANISNALQKALTGEAVNYEMKYPQPDNSDKWYYARYFPVLNNGKIQGIILALTDITERKVIERETLALVDKLQSKNKDLRQFAYIISHNLRAPITKIQGLASLFDSSPDEELLNKSLLENIKTEANNLDEVVKDINTIISARDSLTEVKEYISFEDELRHVMNALENGIKENKVTITADFKVPGIVTVKSYLYSIIYNLVSNAVKYCSNERPASICVQSREDGEYINLSVTDNGTGIDLEKNGEKIFDLYKRFHNGRVPGKGIGLTLVKAQTESMGGRVEVESKVGSGTIFKILLPKL
jgi:PAS domain S-box-containing protein